MKPILPALAACLIAIAADAQTRDVAAQATGGITMPQAWQYADRTDGAPIPADAGWWTIFNDNQLNTLIARMHAGNSTLPQAQAALAAARAEARIVNATAAPQVALGTSANYEQGPLINAAGGSGSLFTARASLSWEADLSGRLSAQRAAARLDAKAAEAQLADARLLLEAETANNYFRCLALRAQQRLADEEAGLRDEAATIADQHRQRGLSTLVEADEAHRLQVLARQRAATARLALEAAERRIAYLVGTTDPLMLAEAPLTEAPQVPPGLPAEMLARRPDLAAALARLQASDKRLQSARRSWLPSVALTASGGEASAGLGQILSAASRDFGLSLLLSLPLFDGGRHKAIVAGSKAEVDLAAARYRDRLLIALKEVNDRLGSLADARQASEREDKVLALAEADRRSAEAAAAHGLASRQTAMMRSIAATQARQGEVSARAAVLENIVALVAALGGGWGTAPANLAQGPGNFVRQ